MGRRSVETRDFREAGPAAAEAMGEDLRDAGLTIARNYLGEDEAEKLAAEASACVREVVDGEWPEEGRYVDAGRYIIDRGSEEFRGYSRLAEAEKTVFNIRGRYDAGMIDCFNVDKLFPTWSELLTDATILDAMRACTGRDVEPMNLNLYYNRSVTSTRRFHVDSWGGVQLKAFLYLSDVLEPEDGAHAYVRGSHRQRWLSKVNRPLNKLRKAPGTDCVVFDPRQQVTILGPKGTMFISSQSGVHRGIPQAVGRERLVLVRNYRIA